MTLANSLDPSSEVVQTIQNHVFFSTSSLCAVVADESTLVLHSSYAYASSMIFRDGVLQAYSVHYDETAGVSLGTCIASVITPNAMRFSSITVDSELDCIVLNNRWSSLIFLYTTTLELRGKIHMSQQEAIRSVHITSYGVLVITEQSVCRFSFCGEEDGVLSLEGM